MQKNKFRILNNTLFEVAQSRAFTEKDNLAEKFNDQGRIVLVTDKVGAGLTLSIVKTEDGVSYQVIWDDSEEYFKGWNMAWEEFQWCLGVVTSIPEETEVAEEVTEATEEVTEVVEATEEVTEPTTTN